jgi:hypothetical protein
MICIVIGILNTILGVVNGNLPYMFMSVGYTLLAIQLRERNG